MLGPYGFWRGGVCAHGEAHGHAGLDAPFPSCINIHMDVCGPGKRSRGPARRTAPRPLPTATPPRMPPCTYGLHPPSHHGVPPSPPRPVGPSSWMPGLLPGTMSGLRHGASPAHGYRQHRPPTWLTGPAESPNGQDRQSEHLPSGSGDGVLQGRVCVCVTVALHADRTSASPLYRGVWLWHCRLAARHPREATSPAGHGAGDDGGDAQRGRDSGETASRQTGVRAGGWRWQGRMRRWRVPGVAAARQGGRRGRAAHPWLRRKGWEDEG